MREKIIEAWSADRINLCAKQHGLFRQYIKKCSYISHTDVKILENIANKLNNRPRKTLGHATRQDIFYKDKYLVKSNFQ